MPKTNQEILQEILSELPDGIKERERIYQKYGPLIPEIYGYHLLCMTYIPPEKTKGNIYLPNQVQEASVFHNMVGLVLDMGDACWTQDKFKYWGKRAKLGDWIWMPRLEFTLATFIGWKDNEEGSSEKVELRAVIDERVLGKVTDPSRLSGAHILGR